VSDPHGHAQKASGKYGYKVLAIHEETKPDEQSLMGVRHAIIALNISVDQVDMFGVSLQNIDSRLDAAEINIVTATNAAHQAFQKADEIGLSNQEMSDKVNNTLGVFDNAISHIESLTKSTEEAAIIATQAKAIATSAAISATSMRNEAVNSANDAVVKVSDLIKTLEPITTWKDPETGNVGASYLTNYIDNGLATKVEIEDVEGDLEYATSAILKNAKSFQSLIVSIDKYSVGEYSMAYGLTLDQATSILEPGIIYAPTSHEKLGVGTRSHKESCPYIEGETTYLNEREFRPGYLYQWGKLPSGRCGWVTIDKHYDEIKDINTSAPSVFFSDREIVISEVDNYGYWYTDTDTVLDKTGQPTTEYAPYTLYKWDEGSWTAVATLAGNTQSRAISQVRQTANSIEASVTNMKGDVAASKKWIEDNSTNIQDVVTWKGDNAEAIATTMQKASDSEAYIAQIASVKNEDGTINAAASIVTAVNEDGSGIGISADRITMTGTTTFLQPGDVGEGGGTTIDGARIQTGTISAERLDLSGTLTVSAKKDLVASVKVLYARSSSLTDFIPTTEWLIKAPQWVEDEYMWQKTITTYADHTTARPHQIETTTCIHGASGTSPYLVIIHSTNGNIFRNGEIETILTATVLHGDKDITDDIIPGRFLWTRVSTDTQGDVLWNEQKSNNRSKQITITSDDVWNRATFFCTIQDE
jgi:hypothetical protein